MRGSRGWTRLRCVETGRCAQAMRAGRAWVARADEVASANMPGSLSHEGFRTLNAPAGLLTSGRVLKAHTNGASDTYSPRLLGRPAANGNVAAFVPGHSGGAVPDLNRIPYSLARSERTNTGDQTLVYHVVIGVSKPISMQLASAGYEKRLLPPTVPKSQSTIDMRRTGDPGDAGRFRFGYDSRRRASATQLSNPPTTSAVPPAIRPTRCWRR